jgi:hypothetical protein
MAQWWDPVSMVMCPGRFLDQMTDYQNVKDCGPWNLSTSYLQYFTSHVSLQDYTVPACRVHIALCHTMIDPGMQCCSVIQYIEVDNS